MPVKSNPTELVTSSNGRFHFRIPRESGTLAQDEEWFSVRIGDNWRKFRIHEYREIYRVPGLYEALVYDVLRCRSPRQLVQLFRLVLENWSTDFADLRVLDLGAGNGIVGERLREAGAAGLVAVDILPEAAAAAERDRPATYDDYVVVDLCDPDVSSLDRIHRQRPNALFTVAALGFGDVPPSAFRAAFNQIATPGWVALTIKEEFLKPGSEAGFGGLVQRMSAKRIVTEQARIRIRHRVSIAGKPIFYAAIVARKLQDIPQELVA